MSEAGLSDMAVKEQPAHWQRFGNAAQISSAAISACALGAIYWQVQFNFNISRNNAAHDSYRAYLQMAMQYPKLAFPENNTVVAGLNREDRARYGGLVSYLLYTCEQILGNFPSDPEWQRACEEQIGYHASYVCATVLKSEIGNYDPPFRALIQKVAATAAECKKV